MSTLKAFSEKERADHAYQARQNFLRQQHSIQKELEAAAQSASTAREREKVALEREEAERKAKEAALAEIERLKAQLRDQWALLESHSPLETS